MSDEKKHKSGFALLKEKYAKLEKERDKLKEELSMQIAPDFETFKRVERERDEWKKDAEAKQTTIHKQAAKISELTAEIANLRGTARDYRYKFEEAVRRMGWLRRFIYGYNVPQFTDEDHWNE